MLLLRGRGGGGEKEEERESGTNLRKQRIRKRINGGGERRKDEKAESACKLSVYYKNTVVRSANKGDKDGKEQERKGNGSMRKRVVGVVRVSEKTAV